MPNPQDEFLDSVITQVVGGYQLTPRLGVQINLPLISREYRRLEDGAAVRGDESGVGDLLLQANLVAYRMETATAVFRLTLLGGLKLPTGNSDPLGEEFVPDGAREPAEEEASGIHGHDLALGSGSVDGLVGGQLYWGWERLFFSGTLHYDIRGEGSFDYRFANALLWAGGPGVYAYVAGDRSLGVQAALTGETKGKDRQQGRAVDDSAVTRLYLGPSAVLTWGPSLDAEVAADIPVVRHNTALQIVPDVRIRAAATWRF
ncbi:MAG TPA: hypothetical protein VNO26_14060 [Candidatus Limnocylindria bacterium]|nr:hypothetical protein [Candidatus Limnocylindria bacterium]